MWPVQSRFLNQVVSSTAMISTPLTLFRRITNSSIGTLVRSFGVKIQRTLSSPGALSKPVVVQSERAIGQGQIHPCAALSRRLFERDLNLQCRGDATA